MADIKAQVNGGKDFLKKFASHLTRTIIKNLRKPWKGPKDQKEFEESDDMLSFPAIVQSIICSWIEEIKFLGFWQGFWRPV